MKKLPPQAHPDHLKKQAKALLRLYRQGDADAVTIVRFLPAAANRTHDEALALGLRLHDAQSCIAREYGFASWADLGAFVETHALAGQQRARLVRRWLALAYGGDVTGGVDAPRPRVAAQLLLDHPDLVADDPTIACAAGDLDAVKAALAADPWIARAGGALKLPPLVAVTHSRLGQLPEFAARLRACARLLLDAGADPNQRIGNRFRLRRSPNPTKRGRCRRCTARRASIAIRFSPRCCWKPAPTRTTANRCITRWSIRPARACCSNTARGWAGRMRAARAFDMRDADALGCCSRMAAAAGAGASANLGRTVVAGDRRALLGAPRRRAAGGRRRSPRANADRHQWLAMRTGLFDVAALLRAAGAEEALGGRRTRACARPAPTMRGASRRGIPNCPLPAERLRLLPDAAAWGSGDAVRSWSNWAGRSPRAAATGTRSALNHAVFRGDADLLAFLLAHGANWRDLHGFGSDALGTLSWASVNEPEQAGAADWEACARVLLAHGVPHATRKARRIRTTC